MSLLLASASGSPPSGWAPDDISGIRSYWNPSVLSAASGGAYDSITDIILANDLEQATAGIRPLVSVADPLWNGKDVAQMTGTQWMKSAAAIGAMTAVSFSIFMVVSFTSPGTPNSAFDNDSPGVPFARIFKNGADALAVTNSGTYTTPYVVDTNPHLIVFVGDAPGTALRVYVDGALEGTASPVAVGDPWASGAAAYWGRDHGPFAGMVGKIGAGGVVDGVISPADLADLTSWSQGYFGTP